METTHAPAATDPSLPDGRLVDACNLAQHLHVVLEDLIQHRDTPKDTTGRRATIVHASLPWNSRVAYLVFDLAKLARGLEANLHLHVAGTVVHRGGSDENTQLALRALPNLALGLDEEIAWLAASQLEAWCQHAREVIGEIEPLTRVPRTAGQPEPRCPWCQQQSLRMQAQAGLIRCVNPVCRDDEGNRPVAGAQVVEGLPVAVWKNDTYTHWRSV